MLLSVLFLFHLLLRNPLPADAGDCGPAGAATGQMLLFRGHCPGHPRESAGVSADRVPADVAATWILGIKKPVCLTIPPLTAVVCYFLFVRFLKIPLPKGLIGL